MTPAFRLPYAFRSAVWLRVADESVFVTVCSVCTPAALCAASLEEVVSFVKREPRGEFYL